MTSQPTEWYGLHRMQTQAQQGVTQKIVRDNAVHPVQNALKCKTEIEAEQVSDEDDEEGHEAEA